MYRPIHTMQSCSHTVASQILRLLHALSKRQYGTRIRHRQRWTPGGWSAPELGHPQGGLAANHHNWQTTSIRASRRGLLSMQFDTAGSRRDALHEVICGWTQRQAKVRDCVIPFQQVAAADRDASSGIMQKLIIILASVTWPRLRRPRPRRIPRGYRGGAMHLSPGEDTATAACLCGRGFSRHGARAYAPDRRSRSWSVGGAWSGRTVATNRVGSVLALGHGPVTTITRWSEPLYLFRTAYIHTSLRPTVCPAHLALSRDAQSCGAKPCADTGVLRGRRAPVRRH